MAHSPAFLDELRARTPIAGIISRRVKLARSGRQWKGCCPFHGEKSPSFYVYDDHFHCFGCGEHGDVITFTMRSQGASFTEAVSQLASEAGLDVPKPSPAAAAAERRRLDLHDVLAAASRAFAQFLHLPSGQAARDYLATRGLTDATIQTFGLGWSGDGRGGLVERLGQEQITPAMMMDAGLMRAAEDGRPVQEAFYNRVMFPIRDRQGRVISFGGRILGAGQPKYVNGPETELFAKRRTLYGLDAAREGARKGASVVAVEGYLDVILLHQFGLVGAVAPLGTALTEEHLEELWRLSPNPILCFDGDAAGARAASRAVQSALPLLGPERSLRIATLPAEDDPDTIIRREGRAAFQKRLDDAQPLSNVLYSLLREATGEGTPEQRANLRHQLVAAANSIRDKTLAAEYRRALLDKFYQRPPDRVGVRLGERRGRPGFRSPPQAALARPVPQGGLATAEMLRTMHAILLRHPELVHDVEEAFGGLELSDDFVRLRAALLRFSDDAHAKGVQRLDSATLIDHLTQSGLEEQVARVLSSFPYPLPACAGSKAMPAEAETGWWHFYGMMHRGRLEEEVAAAERDFANHPDEAGQRRLVALCEARNALRQGEQGDDDI